MPNVEVKFKKKEYNQSTDSGNGVVVFDTSENKIYVGGVCYSSDVKNASYSEGILTIEKSDGTSINVAISNSQPDWNQNDPTAPDFVKGRTHCAYFSEEITDDNISYSSVDIENGIARADIYFSSFDIDSNFILTSMKINGIDVTISNPYFYGIKEGSYYNDFGSGIRHGNLHLQELYHFGLNSNEFFDTGDNYCFQTEDEGDKILYFPVSVFGNTINTIELKYRRINFVELMNDNFLPFIPYSMGQLNDITIDSPSVGQIIQYVAINKWVRRWKNVTPTYENSTNKVTSLSAQSTDTQYPSAKCVYDLIGPIDSALDAILNGSSN